MLVYVCLLRVVANCCFVECVMYVVRLVCIVVLQIGCTFKLYFYLSKLCFRLTSHNKLRSLTELAEMEKYMHEHSHPLLIVNYDNKMPYELASIAFEILRVPAFCVSKLQCLTKKFFY